MQLRNLIPEVLVGVLLAACLAALVELRSSGIGMALLGASAAVTFAALLARFHERQMLSGRTLALFYTAAMGLWAILVNSNQVSDFGVYLRCGTEFVPRPWSFSAWTAACESHWLPGFAFYWRRSLLYSLPLGLVGGAYLHIKVANAALHAAAVVLLYMTIVPRVGRGPAMFSAVLLALFPEFLLATTLVTPDNLVPLLMLALLALLTRALDGAANKRTIVAIVLMVGWLDLLRSLGALLLVGLSFAVFLARDRKSSMQLAAALASSAGVVALLAVLPAWLGLSSKQHGGVIALLVGTGVTHTREFAQAYAWNQYVYPLLDVRDREHLVSGLLALDLRNAMAMPAHWAGKVRALFGGEGYYFFAAAQALGSPDDAMIAGASPTLRFVPDLAAGLRGVAIATLTLGTAGAARALNQPQVRASLALGGAILLYIIVFGEVQARYSVLVAPALIVCAASCFRTDERWHRAARQLGKAAGAAALCMAGLVVISAGWADARLRSVPTLRVVPRSPVCPTLDQALALSSDNDICRSATIEVGAGSRKLRFAAVRDPVPPRWNRQPQNSLTVRVWVQPAAGGGAEGEQVLVLEGPAAILSVDLPEAVGATLTLSILPAPSEGVRLSTFHDDHDVYLLR